MILDFIRKGFRDEMKKTASATDYILMHQGKPRFGYMKGTKSKGLYKFKEKTKQARKRAKESEERLYGKKDI